MADFYSLDSPWDCVVLAQCMRPDIERLASASNKLLADAITLAINETGVGGCPEDFPWSIEDILSDNCLPR